MKPHFEHDCENCTFLGSVRWEGSDYDLYHCLQGNNLPTVIARYSSDGPDYNSGIGTIAACLKHCGPKHPLCIAYTRAIEQGFEMPELPQENLSVKVNSGQVVAIFLPMYDLERFMEDVALFEDVFISARGGDHSDRIAGVLQKMRHALEIHRTLKCLSEAPAAVEG